jgi:hypothetical protein
MIKQFLENIKQRLKEYRADLKFDGAATLDHIKEDFLKENGRIVIRTYVGYKMKERSRL